MKYEAISANRSEFSVVKMCKALGIKQSGFYQWLKGDRRRQAKARAKLTLIHQIEKAFEESKRTYGYRRLSRVLESQGYKISEYKIAGIMRETGLYPVTLKRFKPYPRQVSDGRYNENVIQQEFNVNEPGSVWAGDITYIKSTLGWVYLSVVIDLFNREVVGYSVSKSASTDLVKRALGNALASRKKTENLVFHSDRGCQYSSIGFNQYLKEHRIQGSMSKAGCPYDNSCVESFFATTKRECISRKAYDTMEEIERDLFEYIQIFYNRKRIHSSLGYLSPVEYRRRKEGGTRS